MQEQNFIKRPTGFSPKYFWIVTVQKGTKTSFAIADLPKITLNCFECDIDINKLLVKIKNQFVFDNHREKFAKNGRNLFPKLSQCKWK